jgi:hypothetical protein
MLGLSVRHLPLGLICQQLVEVPLAVLEIPVLVE